MIGPAVARNRREIAIKRRVLLIVTAVHEVVEIPTNTSPFVLDLVTLAERKGVVPFSAIEAGRVVQDACNAGWVAHYIAASDGSVTSIVLTEPPDMARQARIEGVVLQDG